MPQETLLDYLDCCSPKNRELVRKQLRIKDLGKCKYLGHGANGSVFDLNNGRAVKVTRSRGEFRIANQLLGRKLKHIYEIKKTFKTSAYYFIVTPKYEELSYKVADLADSLRYSKSNGGWADSYTYTGWGPTEKQLKRHGYDKLIRAMNRLERKKIRITDTHSGNVMMGPDGLVLIDIGC